MRIPYQCIRCEYTTDDKYLMRRHLYNKKNDCPGSFNMIELTDEIRECILKNQRYIIPTVRQTDIKAIETKMKTLEKKLLFYSNKKSEEFYQILLEDFLNGTHKVLSCCITDISTETLHAEIKDWCNWKDAVGQILCYNSIDPKKDLHVYLFGAKRPDKGKRDIIYDVMKHNNISPFELIHNTNTGSVDILDENENIVHSYLPES